MDPRWSMSSTETLDTGCRRLGLFVLVQQECRMYQYMRQNNIGTCTGARGNYSRIITYDVYENTRGTLAIPE